MRQSTESFSKRSKLNGKIFQEKTSGQLRERDVFAHLLIFLFWVILYKIFREANTFIENILCFRFFCFSLRKLSKCANVQLCICAYVHSSRLRKKRPFFVLFVLSSNFVKLVSCGFCIIQYFCISKALLHQSSSLSKQKVIQIFDEYCKQKKHFVLFALKFFL